MKIFNYKWDDNIFLLHLQLQLNTNIAGYDAIIKRNYDGDKVYEDIIKINPGVNSYRFIVSRTHPKENGFSLNYPKDVILEAFKIDDRAYYPTESFYSR